MDGLVGRRSGTLSRLWVIPWSRRKRVRLSQIPPPILGAALGLGLAVSLHLLYVILGPNYHAVVPGCCYRSGQPTGRQIEDLVRRHGIRAVINLRGSNPGIGWYDEETAATQAVNVERIDLCMWGTVPSRESEFRKLVNALENATLPVLLHCQSGSDRTGLASAAFLLLRTQTSLGEARKQINIRFGHNPWGKGATQQMVLDHYEHWLNSNLLSHAPQHFSHWVRNHYRAKNITAENLRDN